MAKAGPFYASGFAHIPPLEKWSNVFLISSFRRVQNVVCFLLGDSPASDFYLPTFRNTLSVPSSKADLHLKMEQIECSETSAYINWSNVLYCQTIRCMHISSDTTMC